MKKLQSCIPRLVLSLFSFETCPEVFWPSGCHGSYVRILVCPDLICALQDRQPSSDTISSQTDSAYKLGDMCGRELYQPVTTFQTVPASRLAEATHLQQQMSTSRLPQSWQFFSASIIIARPPRCFLIQLKSGLMMSCSLLSVPSVEDLILYQKLHKTKGSCRFTKFR